MMLASLAVALVAPLLVSAAPLQKRTPGRATWYHVGLGACGDYNGPSDFIVALNTAQFNTGTYPSTQCNRGITIHYNGKSAHATIKDECPMENNGCPYGGLDLSEGLFQYFEPTGTGEFYMEWEFDGEGGNNQPTTSSENNTPTTTTSADGSTSTETTSTTSSDAPTSSSETSTETNRVANLGSVLNNAVIYLAALLGASKQV
ncbi:hypothetical protein CPB86DRAFT_569972 [Serendipita vermifera]|nr:hypothetical protein CPB86DRAFT_569972 [Serendipita vermifera]